VPRYTSVWASIKHISPHQTLRPGVPWIDVRGEADLYP
jgi:hypothetical protein